MDIGQLTDAPTANSRTYQALERAGIATTSYRRDPQSVERQLISQRLLMPMYVDTGSQYGERWQGLFTLLENTEEHQTILVNLGQFFPLDKPLSLPKTWYLLHAKRWHNQREKTSVREAIETRLDDYVIEGIRDVSDVVVGIDFRGVSANQDVKVTSPYNWIRGRELYNAFRNQAKIRLQMGRDDLSQALNQGILVVAENVPSLSGNESPHKMVLKNVPVYVVSDGLTERAKLVGYDFNTSDDCMRHVFSDDKFNRKIKPAFGNEERLRTENEIDHHTDFVLRAARDLLPTRYPGLELDYPFSEVSKEAEDIIDNVYQRVMILRGTNGDTERKMVAESTAWMQIATMMAIAHVNSKTRKDAMSTAA